MVPGRIGDEIEGLRKALGSREVTRIRPHLTLLPPVNVAAADVQDACDLLRTVVADLAPLALSLGPLTTFHPVNPVCYLAVAGAPEMLSALRELVSKLETGALTPPPERPPRPFVPHVTINQRMNPAIIPQALQTFSGYRTDVVFPRATLLEYSEEERRWLPVADADLGGHAVVARGGHEIALSLSAHLDPGTAQWAASAWDEYSRGQYGEHVLPYDSFAITARLAGVVVGVAEGEVRGAVLRLGRHVVATDQRGLGIGAHLLRATEHLAAERGCERVRLETAAEGGAAGYYAGKGYEIVTRLPQWREERDFLLLQRHV